MGSFVFVDIIVRLLSCGRMGRIHLYCLWVSILEGGPLLNQKEPMQAGRRDKVLKLDLEDSQDEVLNSLQHVALFPLTPHIPFPVPHSFPLFFATSPDKQPHQNLAI